MNFASFKNTQAHIAFVLQNSRIPIMQWHCVNTFQQSVQTSVKDSLR